MPKIEFQIQGVDRTEKFGGGARWGSFFLDVKLLHHGRSQTQGVADGSTDFRPKTATHILIRTLTLTLDPSDYVDPSGSRCEIHLASLDLTNKPETSEMWVLGQPVLRKYMSVYDLTHRRVGFAATSPAVEAFRSAGRKPGKVLLRKKRVTMV